MTKKEVLIIPQDHTDPGGDKEDKDYKKGLSDIELDDFLSYLDGLKINDKDKNENELSRRGGGREKTKGSILRPKGPGTGAPNRHYDNFAPGVNRSCRVWTDQYRKEMQHRQHKIMLQNQRPRDTFGLRNEDGGRDVVDGRGDILDGHGDVVDGRGDVVDGRGDVVDGPGFSPSSQQNANSPMAGNDVDTDGMPLMESIAQDLIERIPSLPDFLNKDIPEYEFEYQRMDALTPFSHSTKSPEGPDLNDVMEVITDEEVSRSPPYRSPQYNYPSQNSPENFKLFEAFQNHFSDSTSKFYKDEDLYMTGQIDINFQFGEASQQPVGDIFSDSSDNDLFKPLAYFPDIQDVSFSTNSISEQNRLQALKEREKHGLVPYIPDEVPVKRHQPAALSDDISSGLVPRQLDPETQQLISFDSEGDSILHSCIIAGISLDDFENLLESLSSHGVLDQIIDKQNGMWRTALFLAVLERRIDLVDCLLSYNANPNIQGKVPYDMKKDIYDLRSPLHLVAEMGDEELELLKTIIVADNIDINHRSESDRLTALHIALLSHKVNRDGNIIKNCSEVIKTLVDYRADVTQVEDRSSRTPIMLAIETADFQLVRDFIKSIPNQDSVRFALQEVTRAGDTPLHIAAGLRLLRQNKIKMLRFLVRQGAETDAENNIKEHPEDVATKDVWKELFKVK